LQLLLCILRRKSLTVRNSVHRKNWRNYSSKRIPRDPVLALFGFCTVARRHCSMQVRTKIWLAPKNVSCRDPPECSSRECVTKVALRRDLQTRAVGTIRTPILAFVSNLASIQVSLDAFERQLRRQSLNCRSGTSRCSVDRMHEGFGTPPGVCGSPGTFDASFRVGFSA
jgi:hypothetical protein